MEQTTVQPGEKEKVLANMKKAATTVLAGGMGELLSKKVSPLSVSSLASCVDAI